MPPKVTVFEKVPETVIYTVSPDVPVPAEKTVNWAEGSCVAVFKKFMLKECRRSLCAVDEHQAKWQKNDIAIKVFQAKKTKDEKYDKIPNSEELVCVTVNVADYVGVSKSTQEFSCQDFSLQYQIEVKALNPSTGAQHGGAKSPSPVQAEQLVKSQIGYAETGRELLIQVRGLRSEFQRDQHIGIKVEQAWKDKDFMLLHKLSEFEACDDSRAKNYFGQVAELHTQDSVTVMRVKCPTQERKLQQKSKKKNTPRTANHIKKAKRPRTAIRLRKANSAGACCQRAAAV